MSEVPVKLTQPHQLDYHQPWSIDGGGRIYAFVARGGQNGVSHNPAFRFRDSAQFQGRQRKVRAKHANSTLCTAGPNHLVENATAIFVDTIIRDTIALIYLRSQCWPVRLVGQLDRDQVDSS
jgi:hypothetical protein